MDQRLLHVNRYGVLSPPVSMWLAAAFLLRHSLLLLIAAVSTLQGQDSATWAYGYLSWPTLVVELPMWLLVFAWARRTPEGGWVARHLWRRGRELMSSSAGLSLLHALWFLSLQDVWEPWPERFMALLALVDLGIIVGCWRSAIYRSLFREFPESSVPR